MASPLINCQGINKTFGVVPVFQNLDLSIHRDDRLGIIGPNGAGKSTLLKILAGLDQVDKGTLSYQRGLKTAYVNQQDEFPKNTTIREILEEALGPTPRSSDLGRLETLLGRAGFEDTYAQASTLSGGWKKRLAICQAMIKEPELLFLDEPTNHLDLEGIEWLEALLENAPFSYAVISHDRYFLESSCRSILEINRIYANGSFFVPDRYGEYMRRKAEFLEGQAAHAASQANKLRRETEWLRQGAPARSTKQQARIKSADVLKNAVQNSAFRARRQAVEFEFSSSQRKTKKLIELTKIQKSFGDRTLFHDLSMVLGPKMRLGLVGPNGSGKSTLIKVIQNLVKSDAGKVELADQLKVVYYDQNRETLPESMTLKQALADGNEHVLVNGRSVHVSSYAKSFGYKTDQLETLVAKLSGGERARLLLARMLLKPADLLILDEPTNDLDIDTLEVLEDSLLNFPGAVILVTHDRYLMDRVSTGILGLNGRGGHGYFADYTQYSLDLSSGAPDAFPDSSPIQSSVSAAPTGGKTTQKTGNKKLSFNEQREWDRMEHEIQRAERDLATCQANINDPIISADALKLQTACQAAELAQAHVDKLYARWAELEGKIQDL